MVSISIRLPSDVMLLELQVINEFVSDIDFSAAEAELLDISIEDSDITPTSYFKNWFGDNRL